MEEGIEKLAEHEAPVREDIYSKAIRAGKRTYFLDVKSTKQNDYYLTITESKKRVGRDGKFYYEKHKIFLYKEDFDKFIDGLTEMIDFIKTSNPLIISETSDELAEDFAEIEFDELEEKK
ncbi:MAG: PUR family DNA/RNA-binding protein [Bacteroidales bacterium]|nr:PUR family DNA/RNA-binding protein [Bacteroidales bacterium]